MTLREHIVSLSDRELADLLIKEESYDDYDSYDDDYGFENPHTVTQYKTTDGMLFDCDLSYGYEEAVQHQIKLLNSKYKDLTNIRKDKGKK